jgi:hypothetical protein
MIDPEGTNRLHQRIYSADATPAVNVKISKTSTDMIFG